MTYPDSDLPAILGGAPVFPDGPPDWPQRDETVRDVLRAMVDSGNWGRYHGPHVPELCRRLSEYHSVDHALVCCSGTSAVELALRGVGVNEGDEVILSAYDFKANFQNVLHLNAIPVLVDLDAKTWQMNPPLLESAITSKTRAILVSHLHGGVVSLPQVTDIAKSHQIAVVEDACQNPGAMLHGRIAGTGADVGVLSFGGSKLITAGRGGAILTSQAEIVERIKRHVLRGNDVYPLSEIQAAIVRPQIDSLDALNTRRRMAVGGLFSRLQIVTGLSPLQLPTAQILPAYYKVGFRYDAKAFDGLPRDLFVEAIRAEGIAVDGGFRANHLIHASRRFRTAGELSEATRADAGMITLHHPVLLQGESVMDQIAGAIEKIQKHAVEIANRHHKPPLAD